MFLVVFKVKSETTECTLVTMKKVKETIRLIFPPAVLKWIRWMTYKIDVARLHDIEGYMDMELINSVITKTTNLRSEIAHNKQVDLRLSRLILPFAFIPKAKILNILDFGGGAGIHYEVTRLSFPNQGLHWVVVESPNFSQSSTSRASAELKFRSSISEAISLNSHFDLAIASSSLQYTENPISYLEELCAIRAPYLYITRQILSNDKQFVYFNQVTKLGDHGPSQAPFEFSNKKTMHKVIAAPVELFEETLEKRYSIILRIKEEQNVHEFSKVPLNYFGYMCKLNP